MKIIPFTSESDKYVGTFCKRKQKKCLEFRIFCFQINRWINKNNLELRVKMNVKPRCTKNSKNEKKQNKLALLLIFPRSNRSEIATKRNGLSSLSFPLYFFFLTYFRYLLLLYFLLFSIFFLCYLSSRLFLLIPR